VAVAGIVVAEGDAVGGVVGDDEGDAVGVAVGSGDGVLLGDAVGGGAVGVGATTADQNPPSSRKPPAADEPASGCPMVPSSA